MPRRGRPQNLKKGRKKGDPPTRKLSQQKVAEYCLYYLTHGESIKGAGQYVGLSPTYVYEFHNKPEVQAKLRELRAELGRKRIEAAANQFIGDHHFVDQKLSAIAANPRPDPKRGFADQIAAARLLAEIGGFAGISQKQVPIVNANITQNSFHDSDVYIPKIDKERFGAHEPQSIEVEQKLLGSNSAEVPLVGAKN